MTTAALSPSMRTWKSAIVDCLERIDRTGARLALKTGRNVLTTQPQPYLTDSGVSLSLTGSYYGRADFVVVDQGCRGKGTMSRSVADQNTTITHARADTKLASVK